MKDASAPSPLRELKVDGAHIRVLITELKRPVSTLFRDSFNPIRIHKLQRSFKERFASIQNAVEMSTDSMSANKNQDYGYAPIEEEESDDEEVTRKRKRMGSSIGRKRKRILRGAIRYYARYPDSDDG